MNLEPRMDSTTVYRFEQQVRVDIQRLRARLKSGEQPAAHISQQRPRRTGRLYQVFSSYPGDRGGND